VRLFARGVYRKAVNVSTFSVNPIGGISFSPKVRRNLVEFFDLIDRVENFDAGRPAVVH
jgi:hypothetical protein